MKDHIKVNTSDLGDWSRQIDGIAGQVGSALNVLRGLDTSADWWGEIGSMRPIDLLFSGQRVSMGSGRSSVSGLGTALRLTDSGAKDFAGKVRQASQILTDTARQVDGLIDDLLEGRGAPDGQGGGSGGGGGGGGGAGGRGGGSGADGYSDKPRNARDQRELEDKVISHLKLPQDRSRWSDDDLKKFNEAMIYAGVVYAADGSKSYVVYDVKADWKDHKIGRTEYGEDGSMHKEEVEGKFEAGKFTFKPDALKAKQEKRDSKHNGYYDENGNKIKDNENSYANSKREHTLLEYSVGGKDVRSKYHDSVTIGDDKSKSTVTADILKSETTAKLSAGLYVTKTGPDGKPVRTLEPGVSAEIGWSGSVISTKIENEVDVGFGKWTSDVESSIGTAEASAKVEAGIIDGKPVLRTKASAEVNVVKITASTGIETDVVDAKVSASAKVGFGAHVDVGYHDGVFKFDAGAAFGVGGDVSFEINVGKTVGYVADKIGEVGKVAADTAKNIYNAIKWW